MAIGKYSRVDGRRSSGYCSTVTVVAFVALCLVGVWMMTSSSVVPEKSGDVSQESNNEVKEQTEVKEQVSETDNSSSRQFEDNPGDLPEDATKEDSNVSSEDSSNLPEKQEEKLQENSVDNSSEDANTEEADKKKEDEGSKTENLESNADTTDSIKEDSGDTSSKESDSDESEKKNESDDDKKSDSDENEKKTDNSDETTDTRIEEKVEQSDNKESDGSSSEKSTNEVYPSGAQSELLSESTTQTGSFSTQAAESKHEKEAHESSKQYKWKLCNVTAGPDFIPCLDNWKAVRSLRSTKHYEHRERHCPEEPPTCLVSLPEGYKRPVEWPKSRDKVEINSNLMNYHSLFDCFLILKIISCSHADMVLQCSSH